MQLVYQSRDERKHSLPVYLFCVFRDEAVLLEHFIRHYRSLGVTHFILIDNASTDSGPAFLKSLSGINLMVFHTDASYKAAEFGTRWVNQLLERFGVGQFCLTVDVDELLVLDDRKHLRVTDLIAEMQQHGSNVYPTTLLDMYPDSVNDLYKPGEDFCRHSPFYDDWNSVYYEQWGSVYDGAIFRAGGVRKRIFGMRPCLLKFPLFRLDFPPIGVAAGYHLFQSNGEILYRSGLIKPHSAPGVLMHFKFIKPNFDSFINQRILRNEDWSESAEYRAYMELIRVQDAPLKFHDHALSKTWRSASDLESFWSYGSETLPQLDSDLIIKKSREDASAK